MYTLRVTEFSGGGLRQVRGIFTGALKRKKAILGEILLEQLAHLVVNLQRNPLKLSGLKKSETCYRTQDRIL